MRPRPRRRVLITGVTGFLGRAFVDRFPDRYEFVALARSTATDQSGASVRWIEADLRDPLPVRRLPRRIDTVMHFASLRAPSPGHGVEELFAVNSGSVAALLDYAHRAGATSFLLASTGGVCGYRPTAITEKTAPAPFDLYTLSKWHGETVARHLEEAHRLPVAIIRFFFPYGPSQRSGIIPRLAQRIDAHEPVILYAGGRSPRINPVFVDDACELTRRVADAGRSLTVNAAGPQTATIQEIAAMLGGLRGVTPRFHRRRQPGLSHMVGSLAGARRALGFAPRVGLEAGLAASFGRR